MGLFDRFRKLTPASFSKQVLAAIRSAGEKRDLIYDPAEFSIRVNQEKGSIYYLRNSFDMYLVASKGARPQLMRQIVRTWFATGKEAPTEFADLGPDLLPIVRSRGYYELTALRFSLEGPLNTAWPHEVIGDHLAVGLVYDLPESMQSINTDQLDQWNVNLYEALEKAKQNLKEREHKLAQIGEGFYASVAGDSYDASRMLLLDLVRKLQVNGDVVAMVPNRDTLLITGSDDAASLAIMVELARKAIEQRPLSGTAFRLEGDDWQPWLPPEGHPSFNAFKRMHIESLGQEYAEQKQLLDKLHEKNGTELFVATYTGMAKGDPVRTYCAWTKGVETLLPQTDLVALIELERKQDPFLVPWSNLEEVAGDLIKSQDMYPPRFRVDEFPRPEQLQALESARMKLQ